MTMAVVGMSDATRVESTSLSKKISTEYGKQTLSAQSIPLNTLTIRQIFIHLIVRLLFLADIVNGGVLNQEIIYFYNKSQQSAWRRGQRH